MRTACAIVALASLTACVAAPKPTPRPADVAAGLPDPLHAGWKGERVCETLEDNEYLRVLRCTFPPGVGHEKHFHAPHFGYALKGGTSHIKDAKGERDAVTPDGYSWWTGEVTVHENQNIGETTSVYLIIEPKAAAK